MKAHRETSGGSFTDVQEGICTGDGGENAAALVNNWPNCWGGGGSIHNNNVKCGKDLFSIQ